MKKVSASLHIHPLPVNICQHLLISHLNKGQYFSDANLVKISSDFHGSRYRNRGDNNGVYSHDVCKYGDHGASCSTVYEHNILNEGLHGVVDVGDCCSGISYEIFYGRNADHHDPYEFQCSCVLF